MKGKWDEGEELSPSEKIVSVSSVLLSSSLFLALKSGPDKNKALSSGLFKDTVLRRAVLLAQKWPEVNNIFKRMEKLTTMLQSKDKNTQKS